MTSLFGAAILKVLGSQMGIGIALALIARMFPKAKLRSMTRPVGRAMSMASRHKWGKKVYEPVESFIEDTAGELMTGLFEGLDEDDGADDQPTDPAAPPAPAAPAPATGPEVKP